MPDNPQLCLSKLTQPPVSGSRYGGSRCIPGRTGHEWRRAAPSYHKESRSMIKVPRTLLPEVMHQQTVCSTCMRSMCSSQPHLASLVRSSMHSTSGSSIRKVHAHMDISLGMLKRFMPAIAWNL